MFKNDFAYVTGLGDELVDGRLGQPNISKKLITLWVDQALKIHRKFFFPFYLGFKSVLPEAPQTFVLLVCQLF